jgi:hypothetical protein
MVNRRWRGIDTLRRRDVRAGDRSLTVKAQKNQSHHCRDGQRDKLLQNEPHAYPLQFCDLPSNCRR